MKINLSKLLFTSTLITGTIITVTSKSWIIMWIGLEMNLLSFIPMMNSNKNPYENEAAMKYFITQAMASMILLLSILLSTEGNPNSNINLTLLLTSLLTKMGAAPFHLWFPAVMQGLTWINCFILMTWQKIAPMMMIGYQMCTSTLSNIIILMSVLVGAVGGLNQTSTRKMMAYSSISHIGWMLMAINMSYKLWTLYFIIYSLINLSIIIIMYQASLYHLSQIFTLGGKSMNKFIMFLSMLSLAGMPPFLGFLPKWIIIQNTTSYEGIMMITIMAMTTMITLYFYLRIIYSAITFSGQKPTWMNSNLKLSLMMVSLTISLLGIPAITLVSIY
uniref:NADH dehydrogenase subunit 2 n=1 Tax=Prodasineura croconota TaxID=1407214 RepID=UPI0030FE6B5D